MIGPDRAYYEHVREWSSRDAYRAELEALLGRLAPSPDAPLLDLGCGTGAALRLLRARGVAAIGLDRGAAWHGACAERPVVHGDAGNLPFADGVIGSALLMHSISHLGDPGPCLGEVRRVLAPGGRVGIATPNAGFLRALALPSRLTGYRADPTVERRDDAASIRRTVEAAGFRVIDLRPWGKLAWTAPFSRWKERLLVVAEKRR